MNDINVSREITYRTWTCLLLTFFLLGVAPLKVVAITVDNTEPTIAEVDPSVVNKLNAIQLDLAALNRNVGKILSRPPAPSAPDSKLNGVINQLHAVNNKLGVLEVRMGGAIDRTADDHIARPDGSMHPFLEALQAVQDGAESIKEQIGEFLELTPSNPIPIAFGDALSRVRVAASDFALKADFGYYAVVYKRNIPIRFVQFFDNSEQILTDEQLQHVVDVTNRVFSPARIRFHLWKNMPWNSPEFAFLRDEDGKQLLYEWPDDFTTSPLIKPLYYPEDAYCEWGFVRPPDNIETRYAAQMRAGTYCAPMSEMLVYVNQGFSNGGQYPWYSRIIGMTRHHVLQYVFQHEVGHYLGLPHTFPGHQIYGLDYNFGRMTGAVVNEDNSATQRRYYETTDRLWNPETQQWAEFSLFWDLVFGPDFDAAHQFFWSREAAAGWDGPLQPIEQHSTGVLCRRNDAGCDEAVDRVRLEMIVAAGCKGLPRGDNDCDYQPVTYYTGDPEVRAFSRDGSTPDTIQLNVMAYYYPGADGTRIPGDGVEDVFLSASQNEQIERVLTYDIATPYAGASGPIYGLRPELNACGLCHQTY